MVAQMGLSEAGSDLTNQVARTLKRLFENIIAYLRHRITDGGSESINAKIPYGKRACKQKT